MNQRNRLLALVVCSALVVFGIGCEGYIQAETESNDEPTLADRMFDPMVEGKIDPASDVDYWVITLEYGNTYSFSLHYLDEDLQIMVYCYPNDTPNWDPGNCCTGYPALIDTGRGTAAEEFSLYATENYQVQIRVEASNDDGLANEVSEYRLQYSKE